MGFTEVLRLVVDADMRGAVSGMEQFGNKAESEVNRASRSLDRWGGRLQAVGTGMIAFGSVALAGLSQAGQAASDLNEVASASETIFGDASRQVSEFADSASDIGLSRRAALEAASGFGNLFTQVGLASDEAANMSIGLTRLAADFASFRNVDVSQVIEAQTAAFRGEFDALQRFVPTINAAAVQQRAMADTGKETADALTEAEKAAATYALMLEGAGAAAGDAIRTGDSLANQQRQASAEWENLKAEIGEGVIPAMKTFAGIASDVMGAMSGLNRASGGTLGTIATFASVILVAAGALSTIIGTIIRMRQNFADAASAIGNLRGHLGGLARAAAIAAGIGAVAGLVLVLDQMQRSAKAEEIRKLAEQFQATGQAADTFRRITEGNVMSVVDLIRAFRELKESDLAAAEDLITLAEREGVAREVTQAMREELDLAADAAAHSADNQERNAAAVEEGSTAFGDQAEEVTDATTALEDYANQLRGMFDPLFAATDALIANREAQGAVGAAELELTAAQQALNDAIAQHGPNSDEATEASFRLMEAQGELDSANRDVLRSAVDAQGALVNLARAYQNGDITAAQLEEALGLLKRQFGLTDAQVDQFRSDVGLTTGSLHEMDRADPNVNISVNTAAARESITDIQNRINGIQGRDVHIAIVGTSVGMAAGGVRLMAGGGPVKAGEAAMVGEAGPELVVFPKDGQVIPNDMLDAARVAGQGASFALAGGGAVHNHFHFDLRGAIVSSSTDAERWLTEGLNRALAHGFSINDRGRSL